MKWGTDSSNFSPEFFVGRERMREAIGLGENSKTETETNWKCAQNDDELKPELQITHITLCNRTQNCIQNSM
jgi:hypothetical protein